MTTMLNVTTEYVSTFEGLMANHRLLCSEPLIPDGRIHRYDVPGDKPRSQNGWYVLFEDENPTIVFGSWKTGQQVKWSLKKPNALSPAERQQYQERMAKAQQETERERKTLQQEAAHRAAAIWEASTPAPPEHPYLVTKHIQPHGVRVSDGKLIIPAYDDAGRITTLQFIKPDGTKKFLPHGAKKGHYFVMGEPGDRIYLVEGFATGATVHAVTGEQTVVAFDAGNLQPVALRLRQAHPDRPIIICADNDSGIPDNPGLTKAKEAAEAAQVAVVMPIFQNVVENESPPTDFNDLFLLEGPETVCQQLASGEQPRPRFKDAVLEYRDLLTLQLPERKMLYPFLPEGGIAMAFGPRGVGKTFFNLTLAASLSTGAPFLRWDAPTPTGVLYVDGEMDLEELRGRMTALLPKPPTAPLQFLTSHQVYHTLQCDLVLTKEEIRQEITAILDEHPDLRVLILDNISCLFSGIDEDRKKDWEPIAAWLVRLRHRGITILLVHHAGKGGQQRGTSGREDSLDTVIQLNKPAGYSQAEGCHFEVHFTKCRSAKGEELEAIDAKLGENHGGLEWTWKPLAVSVEERAVKLVEEGVTSPTALAEELEISKGYASKLLRKIKARKENA
ncbi:MAG: AAA family ATPase [Nitrospirales bacterium]|nr:AAA family ATPase [Nitrospirales bacterium]